jgi:hypothetical protein
VTGDHRISTEGLDIDPLSGPERWREIDRR